MQGICTTMSLDQNKHLLYFHLREQTHLEKKLAEKENYLEGLGNQIANLSKLVCFVNIALLYNCYNKVVH